MERRAKPEPRCDFIEGGVARGEHASRAGKPEVQHILPGRKAGVRLELAPKMRVGHAELPRELLHVDGFGDVLREVLFRLRNRADHA